MQCASVDGLVSADESSRRCIIECVHGAPVKLKGALTEEWSQVTAETAHRKLSASDVSVTNASDKEGQLPKIFILDNKIRQIARLLGLQPKARSSLQMTARLSEVSSEMGRVEHHNAALQAENRELKRRLQDMEEQLHRLQEEIADLRLGSSSSGSFMGLITGALTERTRSSTSLHRSLSAQI